MTIVIHPTAVVDPKAEIAEGVEISAYAVIGADVSIDSRTWVGQHTVIEGSTKIGKDNRIYQFASIGADPQDKKYQNEPTEMIIGDRNVIREFCTFNRGTTQDIGKTVLGDDNWIMAYVHLAHDCVVGNNTVFANNATLAGHVQIDDYAILGGFTLVHQFCRIGKYAFTGMGTTIAKDVPPYVMAFGSPGIPRGINKEGLKRNQFEKESIDRIKDCYRHLYRQDLSLKDAIQAMRDEHADAPEIADLISFCESSQRGLIR